MLNQVESDRIRSIYIYALTLNHIKSDQFTYAAHVESYQITLIYCNTEVHECYLNLVNPHQLLVVTLFLASFGAFCYRVLLSQS